MIWQRIQEFSPLLQVFSFGANFLSDFSKSFRPKITTKLSKVAGANLTAVLAENMTIKVKMLHVFINSFCENILQIFEKRNDQKITTKPFKN